jgi:hypothetical protein
MATNPPERQAPKPNTSVIRWLLDSDPSIRWQTMRDLTGAPAGEVEPCINGQAGAIGAYFGQDVAVGEANRGIVHRLLTEQLPDGGWNCEAANGWTR